MTRDEMITALTRVIIDHRNASRASDEIAKAVLDLCGPKPLVWEAEENHWYALCPTGSYHIYSANGLFHAHEGDRFSERLEFPTLEAAQSAAQSHADAAHWANTKMGSE